MRLRSINAIFNSVVISGVVILMAMTLVFHWRLELATMGVAVWYIAAIFLSLALIKCPRCGSVPNPNLVFYNPCVGKSCKNCGEKF